MSKNLFSPEMNEKMLKGLAGLAAYDNNRHPITKPNISTAEKVPAVETYEDTQKAQAQE